MELHFQELFFIFQRGIKYLGPSVYNSKDSETLRAKVYLSLSQGRVVARW